MKFTRDDLNSMVKVFCRAACQIRDTELSYSVTRSILPALPMLQGQIRIRQIGEIEK